MTKTINLQIQTQAKEKEAIWRETYAQHVLDNEKWADSLNKDLKSDVEALYNSKSWNAQGSHCESKTELRGTYNVQKQLPRQIPNGKTSIGVIV